MCAHLVELGALNVRLGPPASRAPLCTFLNKAVALPHSRPLEGGGYLFGEEADFLEAGYACVSPLRDGRVADWPALLALLEHLFTRAGLGPDLLALPFERGERRLQLLTGAEHPASDYERLCSFVFEGKFADELSFALAPVSALHSSGSVSGLVVDAGHDAVRVLPVVEGLADRKWLRRSAFAGAALSRAVVEGLHGAGGERLCRESVLQAVKEACPVPARGHAGLDSPIGGRFTLPDGSEVALETAMRGPLEEFYGLGGESQAGVVGAVLDCLNALDRHTRANLAQKLFPTGGSACLADFDAVLARSLASRSRLAFDFLANDDRLQAAYKGSHDLLELRGSLNPFISRREFEESGLQIVLKKVKFC